MSKVLSSQVENTESSRREGIAILELKPRITLIRAANTSPERYIRLRKSNESPTKHWIKLNPRAKERQDWTNLHIVFIYLLEYFQTDKWILLLRLMFNGLKHS